MGSVHTPEYDSASRGKAAETQQSREGPREGEPSEVHLPTAMGGMVALEEDFLDRRHADGGPRDGGPREETAVRVRAESSHTAFLSRF